MLFPRLFAAFQLSLLFNAASSKSSASGTSAVSPLNVFQVQAPLRQSDESASCHQVIVQHDFAASYGIPFVGKLISCLTVESKNPYYSRVIHATQRL